MEVTQRDIQQIKTEVTNLSSKLTEVHTALVGSNMAKDGGLIQRVIDSENEVAALKKRVEIIEFEKKQDRFYIKVIWGLGGTLIAFIFAFILKLIFK